MTNDHHVRYGASVTGFVGGHVAHLDVRSDGGLVRSFTSREGDSNGEALRRALVAALCWLDGEEQLVTPALFGDVATRKDWRGD